MSQKSTSETSSALFHRGEQEMQSRVGKRERLEAIGARMIRSYMPEQHRSFFSQLPFLVVGHVDKAGWPWASLATGRPGFTTSPDANTLEVRLDDFNKDTGLRDLSKKDPVGVLGIELSSRRRNRMNGRINHASSDGFSIHVDQSFGNCPQYIQKRDVEQVQRSPSRHGTDADFATLPEEAAQLVISADTFFVSSYVNATNQPEIEGVDVSHRGGRPGFVDVKGNQLTIPDFPGNNSFNTLGNFLLNPKAGLVFADFTTGDLLQLTGTVQLLDKDTTQQLSPIDNALSHFEGADRGWRFTLEKGRWLRGALPFRFGNEEASPRNALTDTWQSVRKRLAETDQSTPSS